MMTGICPVKVEGSEFANKMVWGAPNLNMRTMSDSNVS